MILLWKKGALKARVPRAHKRHNVAPPAFFHPNKRSLLSLRKLLISLKYYNGEVTELKWLKFEYTLPFTLSVTLSKLLAYPNFCLLISKWISQVWCLPTFDLSIFNQLTLYIHCITEGTTWLKKVESNFLFAFAFPSPRLPEE